MRSSERAQAMKHVRWRPVTANVEPLPGASENFNCVRGCGSRESRSLTGRRLKTFALYWNICGEYYGLKMQTFCKNVEIETLSPVGIFGLTSAYLKFVPRLLGLFIQGSLL